MRGLADLRKVGVLPRAAGFLTVGGRRLQDVRFAAQLPMWEDPDVGRRREIYEFSPGTFR